MASGNKAFLITARTDTGKTTTILKSLDASPSLGLLVRRPHPPVPGRDGPHLSEAAHDQPAHRCCREGAAAQPQGTTRARVPEPPALEVRTVVRLLPLEAQPARRDHQRDRAAARTAAEVPRRQARTRCAAPRAGSVRRACRHPAGRRLPPAARVGGGSRHRARELRRRVRVPALLVPGAFPARPQRCRPRDRGGERDPRRHRRTAGDAALEQRRATGTARCQRCSGSRHSSRRSRGPSPISRIRF